MTTHTLSGYRFEFDGQGGTMSIANVDLSIIVPDTVTGFSYTYVPGSSTSAAIDDSAFYDQRIVGDGGIDLDRAALALFEDDVFFLEWGAGNLSYIYNGEALPFDYAFVLGGDPLPVMNTVADANAFLSSITGEGPITSGTFAPDQTILFSSLLDVATSEDDVFSGNTGSDTYITGAGDDIVQGLAGDDSINGGDGDDRLLGSNGDDSLVGGNGNDTLRGEGGADTIIGGDGDDEITGGTDNDRIVSGNGADAILGQSGADTIISGNGADTLSGGSGNDSLSGGADDDQLFGQGNNDILIGGGGNDLLRGAAGADLLEGGSGDDTLQGGNAADTLIGGTGNDILNGGAQRDAFLFNDGFDSDTITGFEDNIDALFFDNALVGAASSGTEVLSTYAVQSGASVIFDFGAGDMLRVNNITISALENDILII